MKTNNKGIIHTKLNVSKFKYLGTNINKDLDEIMRRINL
jgi:hypothetical protein